MLRIIFSCYIFERYYSSLTLYIKRISNFVQLRIIILDCWSKDLSTRRGSNPRPSAYRAHDLPIELFVRDNLKLTMPAKTENVLADHFSDLGDLECWSSIR